MHGASCELLTRSRMKGDSSMFVIDPETSECLHYEHIPGYPLKKHAHIPREIFAEHPEVEIRNDLIDCQIDVCSVEVRLQSPTLSPHTHKSSRSLRYSRTTSITRISVATSCTGSSPPIYS